MSEYLDPFMEEVALLIKKASPTLNNYEFHWWLYKTNHQFKKMIEKHGLNSSSGEEDGGLETFMAGVWTGMLENILKSAASESEYNQNLVKLAASFGIFKDDNESYEQFRTKLL